MTLKFSDPGHAGSGVTTEKRCSKRGFELTTIESHYSPGTDNNFDVSGLIVPKGRQTQ